MPKLYFDSYKVALSFKRHVAEVAGIDAEMERESDSKPGRYVVEYPDTDDVESVLAAADAYRFSLLSDREVELKAVAAKYQGMREGELPTDLVGLAEEVELDEFNIISNIVRERLNSPNPPRQNYAKACRQCGMVGDLCACSYRRY